jgi:hypothetical protein
MALLTEKLTTLPLFFVAFARGLFLHAFSWIGETAWSGGVWGAKADFWLKFAGRKKVVSCLVYDQWDGMGWDGFY